MASPIYQVYPRHVARGAAERAYRRIVKNGEATEADLLAGAMRYAAAQDGKDPTYTKHPATWLNGKCWLDEPCPSSNGLGQSELFRDGGSGSFGLEFRRLSTDVAIVAV